MTDDRPPWFPCYQTRLLGALSAMKPHVGYTYWIVCLRCYEVGGPIPDTPDALARRTGYNKRLVNDALKTLFETGKLVKSPEGIINPFAGAVIEDVDEKTGLENVDLKGRRIQHQGKPKRKQRTDGTQLQLHIQPEANASGDRAPVRRPTGKHKLPEDWSPGEDGWHFANINGYNRQAAERMFDKFKLHHVGKGNRWERWDKAWETWVRNQVEFDARRAAATTGTSGAPSLLDIALGANRGN